MREASIGEGAVILVPGRWDDDLLVVGLARALDPANDGTPNAIVSRIRVTPDLEIAGRTVRASGQPVGALRVPGGDRIFVVNHSGSADPAATAAFQHGHPGTLAALSLERIRDPVSRDTTAAVDAFIATGTAGPVGAALTPDGSHMLVSSAEAVGTEDGGCRITVFDLFSERVLHQVTFGVRGVEPSRFPSPHPSFGSFPNPNGIAVSPLCGGVVFTANGGTDDVSVLALPTVLGGAVGAEIGRIPVEAGPFGIAVGPGGRLAACANRESARTGMEGTTVALIDVESAARDSARALLVQVRVGTDDGSPSRPFSVAFTPDGGRLLATCFRTNLLAVVGLEDGPQEVARIPLTRADGRPARPRGIAVTPDGRWAAVAGGAKAGPGSGCLHLVDLAAARQVATVTGVGNEPYMPTILSGLP